MSAAAPVTPAVVTPITDFVSGKSGGILDGILADFSRASSSGRGRAKDVAQQIVTTKTDRRKRIAPIIKVVSVAGKKKKTMLGEVISPADGDTGGDGFLLLFHASNVSPNPCSSHEGIQP